MPEEAEGSSDPQASETGSETPAAETPAATVAEAAEQATTEAEGSSDSGSELYTVKVDGEETQVSIEDLQSGYMRQSDYTQKTQAIAETQRRVETLDRFEAQLDADPLKVLNELATAYEVTLGAPAAGTPSAEESGTDGEPESELQQQIRELQEWKAQAEQAQATDAEAEAMAQVDADLEALKTDYEDPDLDENAVLQLAVDNGISDLDAAYLKYRKLNPKAESASPPPAVEPGHSSTAPAPGGDKKMSLADAFAAAEKSQAV